MRWPVCLGGAGCGRGGRTHTPGSQRRPSRTVSRSRRGPLPHGSNCAQSWGCAFLAARRSYRAWRWSSPPHHCPTHQLRRHRRSPRAAGHAVARRPSRSGRRGASPSARLPGDALHLKLLAEPQRVGAELCQGGHHLQAQHAARGAKRGGRAAHLDWEARVGLQASLASSLPSARGQLARLQSPGNNCQGRTSQQAPAVQTIAHECHLQASKQSKRPPLRPCSARCGPAGRASR